MTGMVSALSKLKRNIHGTIGVMLIIFGGLGFVLGIIGGSTPVEPGRFYEQRPLAPITGIFVDSVGNIYYGSSQHNAIQIFNNQGVFLYGVSFTAGDGGIYFYVDHDDTLHIFSPRGNVVLSFIEGYLVYYRRFDAFAESAALRTRFRSEQTREFTDAYENRYTTGTGRNVRMYDSNGNFMRTIRPDSPISAPPPIIFFFVAAIGMVIVMISNWSTIVKIRF